MKFKQFFEAIWSGNFNYKLPKDKERQLYDFYMFTLLLKSGDKQADFVSEEISKELLPNLKKNLKDAVLFSVCAEIRHVYDEVNTQGKLRELADQIEENFGNYYGKKYKDIFVKYTQQYLSQKNNDLSASFLDKLERKRNNKRLQGKESTYRASYNAMTKTTDNHSDIIKLCLFLYEQPIWNSSYGGKAWAGICNGWLRLNKATSTDDLIVAIDHVYDLQHNTDTVFNKLKNYYKDGYGWIKKALDFKRDIKYGHELYNKISPSLRPLAMRILKLKYNKSLLDKENNFKYEVDDEEKQITDADGNKKTYKDGKLHSYNDQPAVIDKKGNQYWYKDGELHRDDDKPAIVKFYGDQYWYKDGVEYKPKQVDTPPEENDLFAFEKRYTTDQDGNKVTYQMGKYHSYNDEPAIIYVDGTKEWYKEGKLHRDNDLPAIIYSNGSKHWYQNGIIHRDDNKPAIIYPNGEKFWYNKGIKYGHENPNAEKFSASIENLEEMPDPDVDIYGTKRWYKNGQLHSYNDMPAKLFSDGEGHWYKDGKKHRDGDKPAVIKPNGDKFWYQNHLLHRDNDQPAVEYSNGEKHWYQNGKKHRDNDQPAAIYADGTKKWFKDGVEYTPSTNQNEETPKPVVYSNGDQHWYKHGVLHSYDDHPALINQLGKYWYKDGKIHRDNDQPAVIYVSGSKNWYQNGVLHRDNDQPAIILPTGTQKWYKNGKLHRDNDLPAIVFDDGTKEYYKNGLFYEPNKK